jgi:hypothetical protein
MTLLYLLIIDFPIIDPLTAKGIAFCVNLRPKSQNVFPLVSAKRNRVQLSLRLSGIEFSLVCDSEESNSAKSQTKQNPIV